MTIDEQRNHPNWQRKRLEVFSDRNWMCEICGDKENTLHAHHTYYRPGAMYWDYDLEAFKCLCSDCHKMIHRLVANSYACLFLKKMRRLYKIATEAQ